MLCRSHRALLRVAPAARWQSRAGPQLDTAVLLPWPWVRVPRVPAVTCLYSRVILQMPTLLVAMQRCRLGKVQQVVAFCSPVVQAQPPQVVPFDSLVVRAHPQVATLTSCQPTATLPVRAVLLSCARVILQVQAPVR